MEHLSDEQRLWLYRLLEDFPNPLSGTLAELEFYVKSGDRTAFLKGLDSGDLPRNPIIQSQLYRFLMLEGLCESANDFSDKYPGALYANPDVRCLDANFSSKQREHVFQQWQDSLGNDSVGSIYFGCLNDCINEVPMNEMSIFDELSHLGVSRHNLGWLPLGEEDFLEISAESHIRRLGHGRGMFLRCELAGFGEFPLIGQSGVTISLLEEFEVYARSLAFQPKWKYVPLVFQLIKDWPELMRSIKAFPRDIKDLVRMHERSRD